MANDDGLFEFGIGHSDRSARSRETRLKMTNKQRVRLSFGWWPAKADGTPDFDADSPVFKGAQRHYVSGKGYFLNGNRPEVTQILGVPPQTRLITIVVKWPIDKNGKIDGAELAAGNYDVLTFVFDPKKYESFSPLNEEFPFGKNDLMITCTNAEFQHMDFVPKVGNLLRKLSEDPKAKHHFDTIMGEVATLSASASSELGKFLSLDELRAVMSGGKVGNGGGARSAVATTDEDIEDALDDALALAD